MGRKVKQECLTLYPEIEGLADSMSDKQLGALMRALIQYRFQGTLPDFPKKSTMSMLFPVLKNQVDRMEQVKQRNSENAKRRWEQQTSAQAVPNSGIPEEFDLTPF